MQDEPLFPPPLQQLAADARALLAELATGSSTEPHRRDLMALLQAVADAGGAEGAELPVWRHKVRGSCYQEQGRGRLQAASPPADSTEIVVYRGAEGHWWARPVGEFEDGRFERVV